MEEVRKSHILNYSCVLLISWATCLIFNQMHTVQNWAEIQSVSQSVLNGEPPWRAFQNRLLMPYLISLLSNLLAFKNDAYIFAIKSVSCIGIIINGFVLHYYCKKIFNTMMSMVAVFLWSFLFCLYQDYWFYTWDVFDIVLFTFVVCRMLAGKDLTVLLLLYPIALLNRESALFLPVAYLLSKNKDFLTLNKHDVLAWLNRYTLVSILLIIIGVAWTRFIRDYMFVASSFGGVDVDHSLLGNHFYFFDNLETVLVRNLDSSYFIFSFIAVFFMYLAKKYLMVMSCNNVRAVLVFYAFLFMNILLFGLFNETRMHFPLLTVYVLLGLKVLNEYYVFMPKIDKNKTQECL